MKTLLILIGVMALLMVAYYLGHSWYTTRRKYKLREKQKFDHWVNRNCHGK